MTGLVNGKVAIITGAGSGLGRAGAFLFAREGAKVVVADVVDEDAQQTAAMINEAGGDAIAVHTDVALLESVQGMVDKAIEAYGTVDILWNNAGVLQRPMYAYVEDLTVEDWDRVLDINLKGVFLGAKCVAPHMKKQGHGVIVNTASIAGLKGERVGMAAYHASKGGVINLTKLLATELGPFNIRVNAVAPGGMDTRIGQGSWGQSLDPTQTSGHDESSDATRRAQPEEVARTVLHLVCDGVGPLTGAIVSIDGGRAAR